MKLHIHVYIFFSVKTFQDIFEKNSIKLIFMFIQIMRIRKYIYNH